MRHKKSSIVLHALKHQISLYQPPDSSNQIFSYIDKNELPNIIQQKLVQIDCSERKVIKTSISPHGFIISFYVAFLKLLFVQRATFQKCVQRLFQILDDDDFTIHVVREKSSPFYLDWSKSKMKRMTSDYFKQIMIREYQSVDQIMTENPDFNKILFLVSWSLLYDSQRVQDFDEFVEFETVKEVLFGYFGIEAYQHDDSIFIPDCSILIECLDDTEIYLIDLKNSQLELEQFTSQSIQVNSAIECHGMESGLKLTFESNQFIEEDEDMTKTRDFRNMTSRTCEKNEHMQKTLKFGEVCYDSGQERQTLTARDSTMNEPSKNRHRNSFFKTQNQNNRPRSRALQSKFKIEKLFELASHRTTTQKSLYDEAPLSDTDEYSVLDISIPTSKKINQKSSNKENQQINDMAESLKPQYESLIGKWYEFCKTKKTKVENIQSKISKLSKKENKKSHFQQTTEKPDFRKVKSRRRKSQDFDYEGYTSQNRNTIRGQKSPLQFNTHNELISTIQQVEKKPKQREYIVQGMRPTFKGENIYSKYGYVNMNISEEFTDSLILKELEGKSVENIKAIKEKAREERNMIKMKVEKAGKEGEIIRL